MSERTLIRCVVCNETVEDEILFHHLRDAHDLDFEIMTVPDDTAELVMAFENSPVSAPLVDSSAALERIEQMIRDEAWWWRPYHRWQLRNLRREYDELAEAQLRLMLEKGR